MLSVDCSDKHSKRARDMHLLKQLKLLLKDHVAENGASSKDMLQIVDFAQLIMMYWKR